MISFIKYNKNSLTDNIISKYNDFEWYEPDYYELIEIKADNFNCIIPILLNVFEIRVFLTQVLSDEIIEKLNNFLFMHFTQVDIIDYISLSNKTSFKINRKKNFKYYKKNMFAFGQNDYFNVFKVLGHIFKYPKNNKKCLLNIGSDTKCLMVAPHPDDEIIGAGALMIKYSNNFDCIVMGSSGVSEEGDMELAKQRSDIRVSEFNTVMETIGIKNHWIFETVGTKLRYDNEMIDMLEDYCKVLDLKQYDYIFLPHPKDGHHEHKFVTNKLFKKIVNKIGYNPDTKIVFYEVWADMKNPNVYFDTSKDGFLYGKDCCKTCQKANSKLLGTNDYSLLDWKYKILSMYESQWKDTSIFITQSMRTKCLNNGKNPIWRFRVESIKNYLG